MTRSLVGIAAILATFAAGCDGCAENKNPSTGTPDASTTAVPASASASASAAAPDGGARSDRGFRNRFGSGPVGALFMATRNVSDLKAEQKAKIEEIGKTLQGEDASPRDEMKDVHAALVAGVKAGKIEGAKIDPLMKDVDKAAKDRHDKEAEALNGLYATLEPAQRALLVKDIREKNAARDARMAARGDAGAGRPDEHQAIQKARLARLTKDLDLDAEQQKKAEAALPKPTFKTDARAEEKKRLEGTLAAFEKDGFDAKKLPLPDAKSGRAMLDQEQAFLSAIVPILKPEQREKLATQMDRQGGRGGHGRHGGPGDHRRPPGGDDDDNDPN